MKITIKFSFCHNVFRQCTNNVMHKYQDQLANLYKCWDTQKKKKKFTNSNLQPVSSKSVTCKAVSLPGYFNVGSEQCRKKKKSLAISIQEISSIQN